MKPRTKFIVGGVLVIGTASYLAASAIRDTGVYYLTPGELAFFAALEPAVSHLSRVFVQVPLAALIEVRASDRKAQTAQYNRIDRKRVDFVLVDAKTLVVQAVVELDDRSHFLDDRRSRDELVDEAVAKAGIKIIRFPAQASYNSDQILERITKALATPSK